MKMGKLSCRTRRDITYFQKRHLMQSVYSELNEFVVVFFWVKTLFRAFGASDKQFSFSPQPCSGNTIHPAVNRPCFSSSHYYCLSVCDLLACSSYRGIYNRVLTKLSQHSTHWVFIHIPTTQHWLYRKVFYVYETWNDVRPVCPRGMFIWVFSMLSVRYHSRNGRSHGHIPLAAYHSSGITEDKSRVPYRWCRFIHIAWD